MRETYSQAFISDLSVEVEGIIEDVTHSAVVIGPEVDDEGEEGQGADDGIEGHGPSEAFDGHCSDTHVIIMAPSCRLSVTKSIQSLPVTCS